MVWFWFFITVNLFVKTVWDKDVNNFVLIMVGWILSAVMTIIPIALEKITYEGAWCFIASDDPLLLYLDFYAWMGFCAVVGGIMWVAILIKIYNSHKLLTQITTPLKGQEDIRTNLNERKYLLYRQLAFVAIYELTFGIFFANRVQISIQNKNNFEGFLFHTIMMSSLGLYSFLIFGLKKQNFELWADLFVTKNEYESINDHSYSIIK